MFGFDDGHEDWKKAYDENNQPREGHFSHELIGGAAAFIGMKEYENHQRAQGKPVSHAFAKEMIAGIVGGEVDKLAETKGMDFVDRERAKREGNQRAEQLYDQHYGGQDQYDPSYDPPNYRGGNNDSYRN